MLERLGDAGFTVPVPVRSSDGRPAVDGVVVMAFITGRRPMGCENWHRVRDILTDLHETTRGWPQRPGFASSTDLRVSDRGGDVALDAMPPGAVAAVRAAWRPVQVGSPCVVHGDPDADNVMIAEDSTVGLIDWDEARVDVPWFDLAAIPDEVPLGLPLSRRAVMLAGAAWEAATSWQAEPAYARRRLHQLRATKP